MNQKTTSDTDMSIKSVLTNFANEGKDIDISAIKGDQLTRNDALALLNFPLIATRELLEKLKDPSLLEALEYPGEADPKNDILDLIQVAKSLRDEIGFIAAPNHPALTNCLSMALFIAMANYLVLADSLPTSSKKPQHAIEWQSAFNLIYYDKPESLHFILLLRHIWLGLTVKQEFKTSLSLIQESTKKSDR